MRRRYERTAVGVTAVAFCLVAAACGPPGRAAEGTSPHPGTTAGTAAATATTTPHAAATDSRADPDPAAAATPPSEAAALPGIALHGGELPGYDIASLRYEEVRGTERSENPACAPLVELVNLSPEPPPAATVLRTALDASRTGQDATTVVTLLLATYSSHDGAASLLHRVRQAVSACADGFRTRGEEGPSVYSSVTALPAPRAGQEGLAYRLMFAAGGVSSPLVFTVVRGGATVVVFAAANYLDNQVPVIPTALVAAQAAKLPSAPT
ncbi:hypothetical protein OG786_10650 [Streptomyces sp. NBC_00101]|uniref:hypothetical protein n=1 Tax=Streptomyces sp. NBC_00101 TaxID=2975651 RepID=UPI0032491884